MAVQGVKGSGIGAVTIPTSQEVGKQMLAQKYGYKSGIGEAAAPYLQGLVSGTGPMAERYMPSLGTAEQFRQTVGLPPADTRGEKLGNFVADIPLYGLEGIRLATGAIGDFPAVIGDYLSSPTDEKFAQIVEEEGPEAARLAEQELGPFRRAIQNQKTLSEISKNLSQKTEEAVTDTELPPNEQKGDVTPDLSNQIEALEEQNKEQQQDIRDGDDLGTAPTAQPTSTVFEDVFEKAMSQLNKAKGDTSEKTIADYKKEFAEATGVDVSGKVDKSQALMALGLSLMQNKAGRGFDVSKALGALGEAGEKAMPAYAQAKREAKAAQVAAGKFALDKVAADKLAQANKIAKAQETVDKMLQSQLDADEERRLEAYKHQNAIDLKVLELEANAIKSMKEGSFKFGNVKQLDDKGLPGFKTTVGIRESDGQAVFLYPEDEIIMFGGALGDVNEGINAMNEMKSLVQASLRPGAGGASLERAIGFANGVAQSFGFNLDQEPIFEEREDENGNKIEVFVGYNDAAPKLGNLQAADAIRDRVIAQFKRFLTQETGNGISNVDIQNIERLLGKINFGGNPADALRRIDEAMNIFTSKRDKINSRLNAYTDKTRYRNEKSYTDSMNNLRQAAAQAYGLDTSQFGTGSNLVKDETTGLDVIKIS